MPKKVDGRKAKKTSKLIKTEKPECRGPAFRGYKVQVENTTDKRQN